MTTIEKLINWWEKEFVPDGRIDPELAVINKARSLAAEERAKKSTPCECGWWDKKEGCGKVKLGYDKPTAPASLVEEIKTYCENITGPRQDGSATIKAQCFNEGAKVAGLEVLKILSRYRPAPSCEGLVEELREAAGKWSRNEATGDWLGQKVLKILSRYEDKAKGAR